MEEIIQLLGAVKEQETTEREAVVTRLREILSDQESFPVFFQIAAEFQDKSVAKLAFILVSKSIVELLQEIELEKDKEEKKGIEISESTVECVKNCFLLACSQENTTCQHFLSLEPLLLAFYQFLDPTFFERPFDRLIILWVHLKMNEETKGFILENKGEIFIQLFYILEVLFGEIEMSEPIVIFSDTQVKYYFAAIAFELIQSIIPFPSLEYDISIEKEHIQVMHNILINCLSFHKQIYQELFNRIWNNSLIYHMQNPQNIKRIFTIQMINKMDPLVLRNALKGFFYLSYTGVADVSYIVFKIAQKLMERDIELNESLDNVGYYFEFIVPLIQLHNQNWFDFFLKAFEDPDISCNTLILTLLFISCEDEYKEVLMIYYENIIQILHAFITKAMEKSDILGISVFLNALESISDSYLQYLNPFVEIIIEILGNLPSIGDEQIALNVFRLFEKVCMIMRLNDYYDTIIPIIADLCERSTSDTMNEILIHAISNIIFFTNNEVFAALGEIMQWCITQDTIEVNNQFDIVNRIYISNPSENEEIFVTYIDEKLLPFFESVEGQKAQRCASSLLFAINSHARLLRGNSHDRIIDLFNIAVSIFVNNLEDITDKVLSAEELEEREEAIHKFFKGVKHALPALEKFKGIEISEELGFIMLNSEDNIALELCLMHKEDEKFKAKIEGALSQELEIFGSMEKETDAGIKTEHIEKLISLINPDTVSLFDSVFEKADIIDGNTLNAYITLLITIILNGHEPVTLDELIVYIIVNFRDYVDEGLEFLNLIGVCVNYHFISDELIEKIITEVYTVDKSNPDEDVILNELPCLLYICATREDLREKYFQELMEIIGIINAVEERSDNLDRNFAEAVLIAQCIAPGCIEESNDELFSKIGSNNLIYLDFLIKLVFPQILEQEISKSDSIAKKVILHHMASLAMFMNPVSKTDVDIFTEELVDFCIEKLCEAKEVPGSEIMETIGSEYLVATTVLENA